MPLVTVDNTRLYCRVEGNDDRPTLFLSHSIGADHSLWDQQIPDLLPHFQIVRYDSRGHGGSDAPAGDYSIERLGRDVLGLADALGVDRFAFCGLSLGGMVGQWLGVNAPQRLTHLVLANTSPHVPPAEFLETRRSTVLENGMAPILEGALQRSFSPETVANRDPRVGSYRRTLLGTNPVGYAGCCAAIRDMDQTGLLARISVPTLVIGGDRDLPTPWAGHGEVLASEIPGARAIRLPAAHLANLERPRSFTAALFDFLLPKTDDSLEAGYRARRAALGDAYVDAAVARTTDLTRDFQEWITRCAWGGIWTRPGLDRRTRRLLVLVIAASLGRWEEFRLHLRAGLGHELEPCDIEEALLQTAIYAGVPAANTAFHIAGEEASQAVRSDSPA